MTASNENPSSRGVFLPAIGASLQGFISTFGGAVVGALIGRRFNGATLPLATGAFACGLSSLLFVLLAEHWRLFRPHHAGAAVPEHAGLRQVMKSQ